MLLSREMRNRLWRRIATASLGLVTAGCSEIVNPFRDDLPDTSRVTTSSALKIRQSDAPTAVHERGWNRSMTRTQDQGVSHWPLWWEDVMEDSGSDDGQFAWGWLDYGGVVYCPARQLLNTIALPISAVVDPPGAVRCSDGLISKQTFGMRSHDSIACTGAAMLPDLIMEP